MSAGLPMDGHIALPEAFAEAMAAQLGDEAPAFFRALESPAALALRLNPRREPAEAASAIWRESPVPWARNGWYLRQDGSLPRPGASIAHAAGAFYLQEASAMAPVTALDVQPGDRVLDLCAAPGGKATQIAAALGDAGLLVSNEPQLSRARALAGNLERMGVPGAVVVSMPPRSLAQRWGARFSAVLVDAPCSGEGMFRREPAARAEWSAASPAGCARRQAEILDSAALLVRPGGRMVYSTCTFNALENEGVVTAFLERHPDFAPEDFALPGVGASEGGMLRLYPHRVRGDGQFVAKLRRAGKAWAASPGDPPQRRGNRAGRDDPRPLMDALAQAVCALPGFIEGWQLALQGDCLCALPPDIPPLEGVRALTAGLQLARIGRNRVGGLTLAEPAHALAMALPPACAFRAEALDDARAEAYLRGEPLPSEGEKGWTLALWRGMPLGWGKRTDGVLKNHLPKGLRRVARQDVRKGAFP